MCDFVLDIGVTCLARSLHSISLSHEKCYREARFDLNGT